MQIITLTTDFGLSDWFVGTMKGIILRIAPDARIVDITHGVGHHDVRGGAFALMAAARFFPEGTIHVAVVDPGVGGERGAIAALARGQVFIGPDNGLLSWAVGPAGADEIFRIENPEVTLDERSTTFHGRDIFAPAAGHVAAGMAAGDLGARCPDMLALRWPPVMACTDHSLRGEVVYIDRFGNAITNIENTVVQNTPFRHVALPDGMTVQVGPYYQSVPAGESVAVCGSTGYLEIAVNGREASDMLNLDVGTGVVLE